MDILVSIIIVNYNTEDLLKKCISSIIKKTIELKYEIIIVDNNSNKGSLDDLIEEYPDIKFKLLAENLGFGVANNKGVEIAKGKFVFFLNPDTILLNNAVFILSKYMTINENIGICGGNLFNQDLQPILSYHIIDFYFREFLILFNRKRYVGFNNTDKPLEVNVIMGADLMISKDLFKKVKGFDPAFFLYFEEVYLCDLIKKQGYKVISIPDAKIIHLEGGSTEKKTQELKKWSYKEHWYSKFIYFNKTKGKLGTILIYILYMIKIKIAVIYFTSRKSENKLEYWDIKKGVIQKAYRRYKESIANNESLKKL